MIQQSFGDEAAFHSTTYTWRKRFKDRRESLGDDERNERPSTAVHDDNVAKMHALMLEQPHLPLWIITEEIVHRIHRIQPEYHDPGS